MNYVRYSQWGCQVPERCQDTKFQEWKTVRIAWRISISLCRLWKWHVHLTLLHTEHVWAHEEIKSCQTKHAHRQKRLEMEEKRQDAQEHFIECIRVKRHRILCVLHNIGINIYGFECVLSCSRCRCAMKTTWNTAFASKRYLTRRPEHALGSFFFALFFFALSVLCAERCIISHAIVHWLYVIASARARMLAQCTVSKFQQNYLWANVASYVCYASLVLVYEALISTE